MLAVVSFIVIHAIERVQLPLAVKGEAVSVVAVVGLLLNMLVLYLLGHGAQDLNRRSAALHVLSDLLAYIAALLSGLIIVFTGWTQVDPLLSLLIVTFILYSTLRLLREALHGLCSCHSRQSAVTWPRLWACSRCTTCMYGHYRRSDLRFPPMWYSMTKHSGTESSPSCAPCCCNTTT